MARMRGTQLHMGIKPPLVELNLRLITIGRLSVTMPPPPLTYMHVFRSHQLQYLLC